MSALKAANLALKFLLELVAFAAFAWWGATVGNGAASVVLALVAPLLAIVLWGAVAAPRASRRLPLRARAPFELGVLGLAVVALGAVAGTVAAIVLGALVVLNAALLTAFRQWEL
ncbi:MAG TPA: YrdB family protein [Conexibacter sp.]|nr:YrdB family protein [Conexibacter sp.]